MSSILKTPLNKEPKPNIVLVMIAKNEKESNEEHCITRCLHSCKELLAGVVVVTTSYGSVEKGNVDGLVNEWAVSTGIKTLVGLTGWNDDFAAARNTALGLAYKAFPEADFFMLIDADEVFHGQPQFVFGQLNHLSQELTCMVNHVITPGEIVPRVTFIRNIPGWAYRFAHHETIQLNGETPHAAFMGSMSSPGTGACVTTPSDGARSKDPNKLQHDTVRLMQAYDRDPHPRYLFYLALHWLKMGEHAKAVNLFQRYLNDVKRDHSVAGTVYFAWLTLGRIYQLKTYEPDYSEEDRFDASLNAFCKAYETSPSRAEALGEIALLHARNGTWPWVKVFALACVQAPSPLTTEFLETKWKDWRGLDILTVALINLGQYSLAKPYLEILLKQPSLPDSERPRVSDHLRNITHATGGSQ